MNFNFIIVIIGIILIVYVAYLLLKYFGNNKKQIEKFSPKKNRQVLLFKTHKWNRRLERFAKKLKREAEESATDFYILVHNDGLAADKINDEDLRKHVLTFTEDDIRKVYDKGFYGMWLSNHWILMWFYRLQQSGAVKLQSGAVAGATAASAAHRGSDRRPLADMNLSSLRPWAGMNYSSFWSIEYDVRITGNSRKIWTYAGSEDYLYPIQPFQDPNWSWKNHYSGQIFTDENKWYGYLQLARYSSRFLDYLDQHFRIGENGQDEMIMFSLLKKGEKEIGLTGSHQFLNKLINDSWSVDNKDSDKHQEMMAKSDEKNQLTIFHPIK